MIGDANGDESKGAKKEYSCTKTYNFVSKLFLWGSISCHIATIAPFASSGHGVADREAWKERGVPCLLNGCLFSFLPWVRTDKQLY